MIIEYEVKKVISMYFKEKLITPCKGYYHNNSARTVMVGSVLCELCDYCNGINKENNNVDCSWEYK